MWRTLAASAALALLILQGTDADAAAPIRRSATGSTKVARTEKPARATKTPTDARKALAAGTAPESPQSNSLPASDDISDQQATPANEPAKHSPQVLNRGEMLSLARRYSTEIAQSLLEGERHREVAVRQKDAIKLACIQDRLSNMKLMKRMSDDRLAATERPLIRQDELNLRHEFRGIEIAYKRVVELSRELNECVGENLEVTSPTGTVPTNVDSGGSNAEIPPIQRPAPASTYQ